MLIRNITMQINEYISKYIKIIVFDIKIKTIFAYSYSENLKKQAHNMQLEVKIGLSPINSLIVCYNM